MPAAKATVVASQPGAMPTLAEQVCASPEAGNAGNRDDSGNTLARVNSSAVKNRPPSPGSKAVGTAEMPADCNKVASTGSEAVAQVSTGLETNKGGENGMVGTVCKDASSTLHSSKIVEGGCDVANKVPKNVSWKRKELVRTDTAAVGTEKQAAVGLGTNKQGGSILKTIGKHNRQ